MGKKGKKAKKKAQAEEEVDHTANNGNDDSDEDQVKHGWVFEMREASRAVKRDGQNDQNSLRLAIAYRKLRLWDKLEDLASKSRKLTTKETCKSWREEAKLNLSVPSAMDEWGSLKNSNPNLTYAEHPTWNNLNVLHYAACQGDVRLLEKIVALGAAIDYPIVKCETCNTTISKRGDDKEDAPLGATALVMSCTSLAMYGVLPSRDTKVLKEDNELAAALDRTLECAILLVQLGANCESILCVTGGEGVMKEQISSLGLNNKNAYQLAVLSRKLELIRAMKTFESNEDKIKFAYCRCGSRLPWLKCHGNPILSTGTHYDYDVDSDSNSTVNFRLSPFTDCICRNNKKYKKYFKCCWQDMNYYQKDSNGSVTSPQIWYADGSNPEEMLTRDAFLQIAKWEQEAKEKGEPATRTRAEQVLSGLGYRPTTEQVLSPYRHTPVEIFQALIHTIDPDRISKMYAWNPVVYASIMEQIDDYFQWTDLHWHIPKSELLIRVKEWNDALSKYCDDKKLTGATREIVCRTYTASAFAPCASPFCDKIETRVKHFSRCNGCDEVAYCSKKCQKEHWPTHRARCNNFDLD